MSEIESIVADAIARNPAAKAPAAVLADLRRKGFCVVRRETLEYLLSRYRPNHGDPDNPEMVREIADALGIVP